jgi:hypothetical protein
MVQRFLTGKPIRDAAEAAQELKELVAYQTERGLPYDIDMHQLNQVARGFYGMKSGRVVTITKAAELKRELAAGRPVIMPAAGRLLGNPNFTGAGPEYHALVLTGFDAEGFITNDPGTRRGAGFRYSEATIMRALHDWNGAKSTITSGPKRVLVFD